MRSMFGGDFASGFFSQFIGSRRRVVLLFQLMTALFVGVYFFLAPFSLEAFYALCVALGFSVGYWAVFVTVASEQFGTNIRATATTTVPNVVRGSVVLLTSSVGWLRPQVGVVHSALIVGVVSVAIALASGVILGEYVAQPVKREARKLEDRLAGPRLVGPFRALSRAERRALKREA